jgi:hypothetical protein
MHKYTLLPLWVNLPVFFPVFPFFLFQFNIQFHLQLAEWFFCKLLYVDSPPFFLFFCPTCSSLHRLICIWCHVSIHRTQCTDFIPSSAFLPYNAQVPSACGIAAISHRLCTHLKLDLVAWHYFQNCAFPGHIFSPLFLELFRLTQRVLLFSVFYLCPYTFSHIAHFSTLKIGQ